MSVTVLMTALLVVVLMQPTRDRLYAAAIFAQVTFYHDSLFGDLESGWYYVSAAGADVLVMIMLLPVSARCILAYRITWLSAVSMCLNALGILAWYHESLVTLYDGAFVVLYSVAIVVMMTRRGDDNNGRMGDRGVGGVRDGFRTSHSARRNTNSTCTKPEARA